MPEFRRGLYQSLLGRIAISLHESAFPEQGAAEIADHHHSSVCQSRTLDVAQYWPTSRPRRFAIIVRSVHVAQFTKNVGVAPMPGTVMLLADRGELLFEVIRCACRKGQADELARFLPQQRRAASGEHPVGVRPVSHVERMSAMAMIEQLMPQSCTLLRRSPNRAIEASVPNRMTPMFIRGNTLLAGYPLRANAPTMK